MDSKLTRLFLFCAFCLYFGNCSFEKMFDRGIVDKQPGFNYGKLLIPSDLKMDIVYLPDNCERKTKKGDTVVLEFDAWMDDKFFETSKDNNEGAGEPLIFTLGKHMTIPGLEQGATNMCIGERRKLVIPPHLAFGSKGLPNNLVPPNAVAKFELELMEIIPQSWPEWYVEKVQLACLVSFVGGLISLAYQYIADKKKKNRISKREHDD